MKTIEYCVCCNSNNVETFPAIIRQFVVDRMTDTKNINLPTVCKYLHCLNCDYVGTNLRFSIEEESRYYKNYMKEEYIEHRCNYEGEKLRPVLEFLSSKEYKEMRKKSFISTLSKFINIEKIESLVDYGGDTGEMIPEELHHAKLYVADIESRVYDDKVIAIQDPSECGVVDLVFCGHTLEHVSDPNSLVADMKRYLKSGGWICIEIPRGRDYSPGYYFHEHINHFNITSLKSLLEQNGFTNLSGVTIEYEKHIGTAYAVVGQLK